MKVSKKQIRPGRWVRTIWDDVGARDGIVVGVDSDNRHGFRCTVYLIADNDCADVDFDQISAVGNYITAEFSGLEKGKK